MNILSVECSASPVSAAIISDGKLVSNVFSNIKLTHSQTLFPIIQSALSAARMEFGDIDVLAASVGPGSFTGIRIGISSIKGLAIPDNLKCVGVSTLLAAAYMFLNEDAIICPVIDARCGQVYNALFSVCGDTVTRLCDDRAIMATELSAELKKIGGRKIILCCDAALTVFDLAGQTDNITIAPKPLIYQNAVGVGLYAQKAVNSGDVTDAKGLIPLYLKLPQAQRELNARQKEVER